MRIWWTTAYYEMLKYSRMKQLLIILILLPLLLIFLLGSAFNTEIKPVKVALFVEDEGELRSSIDQFWSSESVMPYIKLQTAGSNKEVQDYVTEGIVDYGVYIPSHFSSQLLTGKKAKWQTYSGRYQEKNIAAESVVNSYLANINLQLAAMKTFGPAYESSQLNLTNESSSSLIAIGTLNANENEIFGTTSAMQYYSAAYLIMFLLYGGMAGALALLDQREAGTLQRMYAMPASFNASVFGVIVGSFVLAALQAVVIIIFTAFAYDVDWGDHFGLISLICLLTTAAGSGLAIIIASFAKTTKATLSLFMILAFIMTFLSGGMVAEIESLIGHDSRWTINYWANVSLRAIMSGSDTAVVWKDVGVLAIIVLVLSMFAVVRLPKVVKHHA